MDKYGYKNINSRREFEKDSIFNGKLKAGPVENKHLTNYGFVDLTSKGIWGMPGQTRYFVKTVDDLLGASEKMSKSIIAKRKPKGYVGW